MYPLPNSICLIKLRETRVTFCDTVCVCLRSNFSGGRRKTCLFLSISTRGAFRLFKVIQGRYIWCQSKAHMRLPISVRNSNFGHILHRFGSRTRFVLLIPPLFNPNFGGVPVASDRPCWASTSTWALSYSAVKLFSKNSNVFEHGT